MRRTKPNLETIKMTIGSERIIPKMVSNSLVSIDFNQSTINWIASGLGIMALGSYYFPAYAADDLCRIVDSIRGCNGNYEDEDPVFIDQVKGGLESIRAMVFQSNVTWEKFIGTLFSVIEDLRHVRDISTEFGEFSNYNTIPPFDAYAARICLIGAIFNDILTTEDEEEQSYMELYKQSLSKIDTLHDSITALLSALYKKGKRIEELEALVGSSNNDED